MRFGTFEVDLRAGEMSKRGLKIKLQPQPFAVLATLLEHPGELVTREELRQKLWRADTFVEFDNSLNKAINTLRETLGDRPESPHFIETLPRRGYRFVFPLQAVDRGPRIVAESEKQGLIRSIAVLPLENLSGCKEQDYFADGMTEELIGHLGKIGGLRIISRTSVMQYKGVKTSLPDIARDLNVDAVVEGAVLTFGCRVRITAQLIQAKEERVLWAECYEHHLRNVLALQCEVARAIANGVRVVLAPHEEAQLATPRLVDPKAYDLYLRGRYFWNRRTGDGLKKGIDYFDQAIRSDPHCAQAFAGLADCYSTLAVLNVVPFEKGFQKAARAAKRALEIDNTLAEAHAALGRVKLYAEWNWLAAERDFRRAIELNFSYATGHSWYSECLAAMGRLDEALAQAKRSEDLDPLSLIIRAVSGWISYLGRYYNKAIEEEKATLEMDPNFALAHYYLGLACEQARRYQEAVEELQKAARTLSASSPEVLGALGHSYAISGRRTEALRILNQLQQLSKQSYVSPYARAIITVGLGEKDAALEHLRNAYEEHGRGGLGLTYIKVDPRLDSLRSHPEFQELQRALSLPP